MIIDKKYNLKESMELWIWYYEYDWNFASQSS